MFCVLPLKSGIIPLTLCHLNMRNLKITVTEVKK